MVTLIHLPFSWPWLSPQPLCYHMHQEKIQEGMHVIKHRPWGSGRMQLLEQEIDCYHQSHQRKISLHLPSYPTPHQDNPIIFPSAFSKRNHCPSPKYPLFTHPEFYWGTNEADLLDRLLALKLHQRQQQLT